MSVSLDQFRAEGELETRGSFRLDEAAAREKLQQFRLKDPHAWVLELVRAAHMGEAVSISFSIGPGKMSCSIEGLEIPAKLAKEWAHAPFEDLDGLESRVLRHVAIGLATLQGLAPRRVIFEAGTGAERVRIEIENGQERQTQAQTVRGIHIGSEGAFTFGFKRFFENLFGELAEVSHLKKSCQFPRLPLFINEERFGKAMHIHESDVVVAIQSPIENGVLGLKDIGYRQLGVYQHGVLLEEIVETVDGVWNGYEALVNTTRVNTDLGGQRIVRDRRFDALQALVQSTWCRAVERRVEVGTQPGLDRFVRQTLQAVELARIRNIAQPIGLERLAEAFDHYPVWPQMVGHRVNHVSIEDLRKVEGRRLLYVTSGFSEAHVRERELVLLARRENDTNLGRLGDTVWIGDVSMKTLEYRLDKKMYDMSGEFRDREAVLVNQERWRRSPVDDPKLKGMLCTTRFQHRVAFCPIRDRKEWTLAPRIQALRSRLEGGDESWEIELGFGYRTGRLESTWIKDGHLLSRGSAFSRVIPTHQILGLDIAISIRGDIPPNRTFTGPDPRSKRVRSAVVRVVEETLDLAIGVLTGQIRTIDTFDITSGRLAEVARWVVKSAINGELADHLLDALGLEALKEKDIGYSDRIRAGASTTMTPAERVKGLGSISKLALYRRGGSRVSLDDLICGPERITYRTTLTQRENLSDEWEASSAAEDMSVLFLTEWELEGVRQILGSRLEPFKVSIDLPVSTPVLAEGDERQARLSSELTNEVLEQLESKHGPEVVGPSVPFVGRAKAKPQPAQHTTPFEIPEHLISPNATSSPVRPGEMRIFGLAEAAELFNIASEPYLDELTDWILSRCDVVFGEPNLRGLKSVAGDGRQVARVVGDHVELDSTHPIVHLARSNQYDTTLMGLLGSSTYTVINCHFLSVEDRHEYDFLSGVIDRVVG